MAIESYICPTCGSEVRVGEKCPGCAPKRKKQRRAKAGAPRKRSWEQDEAYDGLSLPDEDFDYDDFVAREFGSERVKPPGLKWYWWVTGLVLLVLMGWAVLGGLF